MIRRPATVNGRAAMGRNGYTTNNHIKSNHVKVKTHESTGFSGALSLGGAAFCLFLGLCRFYFGLASKARRNRTVGKGCAALCSAFFFLVFAWFGGDLVQYLETKNFVRVSSDKV